MEKCFETSLRSGKNKRCRITESSKLEDKDVVVESLKNKKMKPNKQVIKKEWSHSQNNNLASTNISLADETNQTKNILDALSTLTTTIKIIQDGLSELNKKFDSLVKNGNVFYDDEALFLEDYWPWKDESQMKEAETLMNNDKADFNRTIMMLKRIGGHDPNSVIINILKTTIVDDVAIMYSWAGKKKKKSFVNAFPTFAKVIFVVARYHYNNLTDESIKEVVSRWLKQAPLRITRAEMKQSKAINNQSSNVERS